MQTLRGERVVIIANPTAGAGDRRGLIDALADQLGSAGLEPELAWTERPAHATELAASADPEARCVVACGGDGTLGEVINGRPPAPIAILPLGNENLFARELGYAKANVDQTARAIVDGHGEVFDLGAAGETLFSTMAGIGLDALVVDRVDELRRGHISRLFYVLPTFEAVLNYSYAPMRIEFDDGRPDASAGFVFIFNVAQYGGGLRICPEASGRDGLLDVCLFRGGRPREFFRYMSGVALGLHTRMADFEHIRTRQVRVSADDAVRYQLDGDPGGSLPETFACVADAATFVVPVGSRAAAKPLLDNGTRTRS